MRKIFWKNDQRGGWSAQAPGLRLAVRESHYRYNCTRRYGWAVHNQAGERLGGSNWMRWSSVGAATAELVRYLKRHHPGALEEGLNG